MGKKATLHGEELALARRLFWQIMRAWVTGEKGCFAYEERQVLADLLEEHGCELSAGLVRRRRLYGPGVHGAVTGTDFEKAMDWGLVGAMNELLPKYEGNLLAGNAMTFAVCDVARTIFRARQRRDDHPEGRFDGTVWYPSKEEDCGDVIGRVRQPTRRWPYSYMIRCRTYDHCKRLVWKALFVGDGGDPEVCVPPDVRFTACTAAALPAFYRLEILGR